MAFPESKFVANARRRAGCATEESPPAEDTPSGGRTLESGTSTQWLEHEIRVCPPVADPCVWAHLTELQNIARGAFGTVYRAWDTRLQRWVALKLYGQGERSANGWFQFGLREARLLARIRHSNVVTVYGVDHRQGRLGMWMEFIHGRTLEALMKDLGPLTAREAAHIGFDVCSAVSATHEVGLLHCDITAKNVMREDGGRIVLMDFGLSHDLRGNPASAVPGVCGTPLYMAPELLRGESCSARSDIYSIGVLLYRLVTGSFPLEARTFNEVRAMHSRGEVTLLRDRRPDLPQQFLRAVEQSLSLDAGGRFSSPGHMASALSEFLADDP
jgi:serine/threonine-protein kinase